MLRFATVWVILANNFISLTLKKEHYLQALYVTSALEETNVTEG